MLSQRGGVAVAEESWWLHGNLLSSIHLRLIFVKGRSDAKDTQTAVLKTIQSPTLNCREALATETAHLDSRRYFVNLKLMSPMQRGMLPDFFAIVKDLTSPSRSSVQVHAQADRHTSGWFLGT